MIDRERCAPVLLDVDQDTYLRQFVMNDAPQVAAAIADNADFIGRFEPWAYEVRNNPEDYTVMRDIGLFGDFAHAESYGVFYRHQLMGGVVLHTFVTRHARMGYWRINTPEARGRGLITKSARRVARMAFTQLGIETIGMEIAADNTASRQVAERLGAELSATTFRGRLSYILSADSKQ